VQLVRQAGTRGVVEADLAAWLGRRVGFVRDLLARAESVVLAGEHWLSAEEMGQAEQRVLARLAEHHREQPLSRGMPKQALVEVAGLPESAFATLLDRAAVAGRVVVTRDLVAASGHRVTLTPAEEQARQQILGAHEHAGLSPPDLPGVLESVRLDRDRGARLVRLMLDSGELVRLREAMLVHGAAMAGLLRDMASWYQPGQSFSVPDFKERSGVSRKHAIPLLEWLDSQGYTRRQGEGRVWTGRSAGAREEVK
jgi:selenocysteine-specific elongation factor